MKNLECETMEKSFRGDTFRSVLHLYYGKARCVPEQDAVYRVTEEGLWQGISEIEQNILNAEIYKDLWLYFDKKYPELLLEAYKIICKIKANLILNLNGAEESKLSKIIAEYSYLNKLFESNKTIIDKYLYKNIKLKNKARIFIYNYLREKLSKKGLI